MKKLILALALVMMSLSATAKNADKNTIRAERMDSIRVEYLNQDTDYTYPKWFIVKENETDSTVNSKIFFKLGSKVYKATRQDLINACTGKREYGNYFIKRTSDGNKVQFFFKNYVEE